ncbi:MAG TPA: hypothetical protein VIY51_03930 [Xanthobacteraceae bacterium]
MIDRRCAIYLAFAALGAAALPAAARAQQSFQRFVPFLVELPGWKANKPDGMAMEMAGSSMVTAARAYERGAAKVNASVLTGAPAQGALAATSSGFKMETGDLRMSTATVDGMQVSKTYTISSKSGAILVALTGNAVFTLSYTGIDDEEAMGLAGKFDWKAIQAQAK